MECNEVRIEEGEARPLFNAAKSMFLWIWADAT